MFNRNTPHGEKPGFFDTLQGGFANTLAAMVALVLSMPLYEYTEPYVYYWASRSYPPGLVDAVVIAWMILCWPFCYFAARASIVAALAGAAIYIGYKLI
ncbi:MAG: hypothetical protein ACU0GG_13775 [Paracoccaceae bacterium]